MQLLKEYLVIWIFFVSENEKGRKSMAKKYYPGKVGKIVLYYFTKNEDTGEFIAYYPMPLKDSSDLEYAKVNGFDTHWVKLGVSPVSFPAIMVPCNNHDSEPRKQIRMAMKISALEIRDQSDKIKEARCLIPAKKGLWKRCPNSNNCDGTGNGDACPYANFKRGSTLVPFSELERKNEDGDSEPFDIVSAVSPEEDARYKELSDAYLNFVTENKPKFLELAKLKFEDQKLAYAEEKLNKSHGTIWYQDEKLKELAPKFLDNLIGFQSTEF